MRTAREQPQHPCGILGTGRLPQDLPIHDDGRVSREDEAPRFAPADRAGLGFGDAADIRLGQFKRRDVDSGFTKQVGASRRRGGENQTHGLIML